MTYPIPAIPDPEPERHLEEDEETIDVCEECFEDLDDCVCLKIEDDMDEDDDEDIGLNCHDCGEDTCVCVNDCLACGGTGQIDEDCSETGMRPCPECGG